MKALHDKASDSERFEGAERFIITNNGVSVPFIMFYILFGSYTSGRKLAVRNSLLEQAHPKCNLNYSPRRIKRKP